jgi:two-component system sensor histidine kinase KdpD
MKMEQSTKTRKQTSKLQATHESESLKLVFLDAITHDFKTPLTSIKASVTGLLSEAWPPPEPRGSLEDLDQL